jgi:acetyl-CoA decarbonylase/synthase complex subunit gamma
MDEDHIKGRLKRFNDLRYDRVGLILKADLIAVKDTANDKKIYTSLVERVRNECPDAALILMSDREDCLKEGAEVCGDHRPLLYCATIENFENMAEVAKKTSCPLAVKGKTLGETAEISERLQSSGLKDLVLDTGSRTIRAAFEDQVAIRRASIKHKYRTLGFPTICFTCEMAQDPLLETIIASVLVAKYAGIIVLSDLQGDTLFPLLLERLNIFTDPQRPMVVEENIYSINGPNENSPVLITCNFSLTYFIVSGEIESSKIPSWLLIKDTEGLSVLTAWAAGKFSADLIAMFIKKSNIEDRIKHRSLIIPGYLASIKGELEEELPDWQIQIGPREASHIPSFLRDWQAEV